LKKGYFLSPSDRIINTLSETHPENKMVSNESLIACVSQGKFYLFNNIDINMFYEVIEHHGFDCLYKDYLSCCVV
jgi:hypothetical protein